MMNLEIGATVGDYQVVGILGAGGMGQVYKVRNVISDRVEAMKVLLPDLVNQPDLADRFLREIKVQASLEHPNIAALHTAVRVDNQLLMLMEFVEGVTLDQKLKDGPLPAANAVDYIMQVLAALEYAHARGVVHRDIKPANMMLTPSGVMKLMDFGIARSSADHKLTQTGTTVGSLYYMSPEQIQGVAAPDARSDLYSVGVSLYELVTAKRPFDGDSQFAIMSAHLAGTPVPPVKVDPRLPQSLNDVILMSVAKDPNARFQTAGAVRNALSRVAAEVKPASATADTITAVPLNRPAPVAQVAQAAPAAQPAKPGSRRGLWMGLGAVAAVAAIVAVVSIAPWKGTGAASVNVAAPAVQSPAAEPPAPAVAPSQPEPQPQPVAATPVPASDPAPVSQPLGKSPRAAARPADAARPVPTVSQPVTTAPAAASAPQPAAPQPAAAQPPTQPAASGPSRAELQQVREHIALLGVRAAGIRTSLESLQRSQAASGMSLRGDMQQAATLMTTYLEGADAALNAGDVVQSRSFADKAERQVEKLEKFFNR
jgi:serine/threonine-protein kinase